MALAYSTLETFFCFRVPSVTFTSMAAVIPDFIEHDGTGPCITGRPPDSLRRDIYVWLILGLILLVGFAYGLNRVGHYSFAAGLTIACAILGPWGPVILDPGILQGDFVLLTYVALTILLSSMLLPPIITIVMAGFQPYIEKALSRDEIIQTLGEELYKIDLTCAIALFDQDQSLFTINYTSIDAEILEQIERVLGYRLIESTFSLKKSNLKIEETLCPAVVANPEDEMRLLFIRHREKGVLEIFRE